MLNTRRLVYIYYYFQSIMNVRTLIRQKLFAVFSLLLFSVTIVYLYLNYLQETYENIRITGDRCMSELTSIKYQLDVIMEYKNRIDKLLTETQAKYEKDKERFKDIMESCVAMKQQSSICQSQFEDLQSECKRVKEDYDKIRNLENKPVR